MQICSIVCEHVMEGPNIDHESQNDQYPLNCIFEHISLPLML